jgi:hypothetical protein
MASRIHVEFGPDRFVDLSMEELSLLRLVPYQAQLGCASCRWINCLILEVWPDKPHIIASKFPASCPNCRKPLDRSVPTNAHFLWGLDFGHNAVRYNMVNDDGK